jgi:PAS domain S-box-containing protein
MRERLDGDAHALGMVLEAIPEVVLVVDREGTIQYINQVEDGYERERVIGTQADTFLWPGSEEEFWAVLKSVCETGEVVDHEVKVSSPTGEAQWYRTRMAPLYDDGAVNRVMIMATNISELKAAQAEAERWRRLLPICSWCGKVRDERGQWQTIEAHLERESRTKVSHGLCPGCYEEQMGGAEEGNDSNGNVA